jgi:hypothetical protein
MAAAATAILIRSKSAEGDEALKRTRIGASCSSKGVFRAFGLYAVIGVIHFEFPKRFLLISFEPERKAAEGTSLRGWDFRFYVLCGLRLFLAEIRAVPPTAS